MKWKVKVPKANFYQQKIITYNAMDGRNTADIVPPIGQKFK